MKATREEMRAEAIKRMNALRLHSNVIDEFTNEDLLNESEYEGALYWLNDSEKKLVNDFESESGCLVYHMIHNMVRVGDDSPMELYNMLFVGEEKEDWEMDWEDINDGYVVANVENVTDGFADMGCITVRPVNGGLVRLM